jgi:DNA-binding response OmpR family regulator
MKRSRVLIVDDDKEVLEVISLLLQKRGYETITASSGKEGLRLADSGQPNLILLDIMLPDIDGFNVLRKLRVNTRTYNIPVIVVSGKRDSSSLMTAGDLQSKDYIMKPFTSQELIKIVSKYLGLINFPDKQFNIDQAKGKLNNIRSILEKICNNEDISKEFKLRALKELDEAKELLP